MFSLEDVENAQRILQSYLIKTPLIRARPLEEAFGLKNSLYLKCENLQITNSFKARGAFLAMYLLKEKKGVVTRSSGNFALGVAKAAKFFSIPAHIVLSKQISSHKKMLIEQYDPVLYFCDTRDEENSLVEALAKEKSLSALSPFDHDDVLLGQATLGLEIFDQLPTVKYFIGPIGGGGLMGGGSAALKLKNNDIVTIGVEPQGANDYLLSRNSNKRVKLTETRTICEGLQTPCVGEKPYILLEKFLDEVVLVPDMEIQATMRLLYEKMGIILEPSGAISASIFFDKNKSFNGDIVCVLSGANIAYDQFLKLMDYNERDKSSNEDKSAAKRCLECMEKKTPH